MNILLVGTGYMAQEYGKILAAQKVDFDIVGRGKDNCGKISALFQDVSVYDGGLENFIIRKSYTHAIIATNVDFLATHTKLAISAGIPRILVEKPGGRNLFEIESLSEFAASSKSEVFVAYNRRFYSSVVHCQKLIEEEGGVLSFNFEFTEWPHTIEDLPNYDVVRENLLFANSTHVIDLAFYLGGFPIEMNSLSMDKLSWHDKAIFAGSGVSDKNALFVYSANWKGPGRWNLEMITAKSRYIFRPMEKLQVQRQRTVHIEEIVIDDKLDTLFKPGAYEQVNTFLNDPHNPALLRIEQQALNCKKFYQKILNGKQY